MIPQVIHYCWFGKSPLPESAKKYIASWTTYCPGYEIRRWDETTFDVGQCRFSREAYASRYWAFVSDYARLRIILDHGGIYLDTDVELVKPLDSLLRYHAFFGFQHDRTIATGLGFGAMAAHRLVAALVKDYESSAFLQDDGQPALTPCPVRDSAVLQRLGVQLDGTFQERDGVAILPADYLCPKSYESGRVRCTDRTLAIHHYDASWHGESERADMTKRRRYARLAGAAVGQWLYRAEIRANNLAIKLGRFFRAPAK
jgi:phage terminase large subunit-like protein